MTRYDYTSYGLVEMLQDADQLGVVPDIEEIAPQNEPYHLES